MDIKIIRTSSIYGPYDNFNEEKSHVIPAIIKKALKNNKSLSIWGDKNVVRDFVYVEDLVDAMLRIAFEPKIKEPINFSLGKGLNIINLAKLILKISGKKKKIVSAHYSRSSAPYRVLDNQKINKYISVKRTEIQEGLKKTIDWYKKNGK